MIPTTKQQARNKADLIERLRRSTNIYNLRKEGLTIKEIASVQGISATRVRQLLDGHAKLLRKAKETFKLTYILP